MLDQTYVSQLPLCLPSATASFLCQRPQPRRAAGSDEGRVDRDEDVELEQPGTTEKHE